MELHRGLTLPAIAALLTSVGLLVQPPAGEGRTPATHPGSGPPESAAPSRAPELGYDSVLAAATFDSAWTRIRDTHYDAGMRGLDWEEVRRSLRPRAAGAATQEELREVIREMLALLGESHFVLIPGEASPAFEVPAPQEPTGEGDPGLEFRRVGQVLLVSGVRPGSPAERAGIGPGWVLEGIGELPVDSLGSWIRRAAPPGEEDHHLGLWLPAAARSRILGPEGTNVHVRLRDADETLVTFDLLRAAPAGESVRFGNMPPIRMEVAHRRESLGPDLEVGVIRLSAWFPPAVPAIARAMAELRGMDGIVLDLRGNPGGLGALVMGVGGHFLDEPVSLGTMRTRDAELRFVVNPQRVAVDGGPTEPYGGPLAILVDPLSASTSEIFAGGMQALGRARVFGEPTAGHALPALVTALPNGDRLLHAVADFTAPDGSRLEGRGVRPDEVAGPDRHSLLQGRDLALEAALEWIRGESSRP